MLKIISRNLCLLEHSTKKSHHALTRLYVPRQCLFLKGHFPLNLFVNAPKHISRLPVVLHDFYRQRYFCTQQQQKTKQTFAEKFVLKSPTQLQPYLKLMRIDKPTGTWLLLWPCYWSLGMATGPGCFPDPSLIGLFGCGTLLMRGAGCTINDMWDKDIDSKVLRTRERPLASGEISLLDATMFLGGQLSLALFVLLQFNWYSIVLGSSSLFLVTAYPLMKRVTFYPQLVLGLTFNWGALMGWSSLHGACQWSVVLPLYSACIFWTMIYDTIYAHQDKIDDVLVKVKSTALKFGDQTKSWLSLFASGCISSFLISGYVTGQTWPFYLSLGAAASMFASQIISLDINDPKDCFAKFKSNQRIGWIIFCGIVGGTYLKSSTDRNVSKKMDVYRDHAFCSSALQKIADVT